MAGSDGPQIETSTVPPRVPSPLPPGEKAAVFYRRLEDVLDTVACLLRDSIEQREMCAFVCRTPPARLRELLRDGGLDLDMHPSVVLIHMDRANIGRMSEATIGEQMRAFAKQARALGYSGARLILNVPEDLAAQVPSDRAWRDLDAVREELNLTVVCLYDMSLLSPEFLLRSLASYPMVIIDGVLSRNSYYLPSMGEGVADPNRDLFHLLDNIRVEQEERLSAEEERSRLARVNRELQGEVLRRKMMEFSLLQADINLRTMLDAIEDMVFMVDRELRVTNGNQTFVRYLEDAGMPTSYEGRGVYELFPGAPSSGRRIFEEIFQYGCSTIVDVSLDAAAGRVEAELRLVPIKMMERVDRIVVIARQRSANPRQMQEMWDRAGAMAMEAQDPEGSFRGTMNGCPHPVMVSSADGRVISVNRILVRSLGYSVAELNALGGPSAIMRPRRQGSEVRRASDDGRMIMPCLVSCKDGSVQAMDCYVMPFDHGEGVRQLTILHPVH